MGAAGAERHPQERPAGERLGELEVGDGVAGAVGRERHPGRIAAVAADRRLDPAAPGARPAAHERQVGAVDPAPAQLRLQPGKGALRRARRAAARRCRGRAGGRCPGGPRRRPPPRRRARRPGSAPAYPGTGVHEQARRLVDHHQLLVGVDAPAPRCPPEAGRPLRLRARAGVTTAPAASRCDFGRARPVHQHQAGLDQPLGTGPRSDVLVRGHEPVEAHAAGVRRHPQLDHGSSSSVGCSASAGAGPGWCSTRIRPSASSPTPITMKLSARLKVGQWRDVDEVGDVAVADAVGQVRDAAARRAGRARPETARGATPERAKWTSIQTTAAAVSSDTIASLPGKIPKAIPLLRTCVIDEEREHPVGLAQRQVGARSACLVT